MPNRMFPEGLLPVASSRRCLPRPRRLSTGLHTLCSLTCTAASGGSRRAGMQYVFLGESGCLQCFLEFHTNDRAHAGLFHSHTVDPVRRLNRARIVGDDHELAFALEVL